jgi:SAM-dependent methyltransferase
LVHPTGEGYRNDRDASHYLVPGRAEYLGDFVQLGAGDLSVWERLPTAVQTGEPVVGDFDPVDHPSWERVVRGAAPVTHMLAGRIADTLDLDAAGPVRILDLGGGAGALSGVWLALDPDAEATQIDWPRVNAVAREHVATYGVADRFHTIDGDATVLDYGEAAYDIVVASMLTHFFAPEVNVAIFEKARRALAVDGVLVVADMMEGDDGEGDGWAMAYAANMLLATRHGATYPRREYARWAREAGFAEVLFESLDELPHTVLYAR